MKLRTIVTLTLICGTILVVGLYLWNQPEQEIVAVAAVPAPARPSIQSQTTTVEQLPALPATVELSVYANTWFNYHLGYPANWHKQEPSTNVVIFQSPDQLSQVKVEAVGPLPADGLTPFVDRSLGPDVLITRQTLTIQGLPAERVVVFSDAVKDQVTTFYVDAGTCAYVITGLGQQKSIEQIARSFNAPELVAQH
jgi:hypothetical protein